MSGQAHFMRMPSAVSRRERLARFGSTALLLLLSSGTVVSADGGVEPSIVLVPMEARPGATVHVIGSDFAPFVDVELSLRSGSRSQVLGAVASDADGQFSRRVVLPLDLSPDPKVVQATSEDGAVAESPLRLVPDAAAGASTGEGPQRLDDRLPTVLVFGVLSAILVLSLVVVWGLYHGAAVRLHRARVELGVSRSLDPLFVQPRRRRRGSPAFEPVSLERVGGASREATPPPASGAASGSKPDGPSA